MKSFFFFEVRSILTLAVGLVILFIFALKSSYGELVYPPDCEGPGCLRTAQAIEWPSPPPKSAFKMELHQYVISLASPPKRVIRQWGGDLAIFCQDGSWFDFSIGTNYMLADGGNAPEKSNFTVADSAQFVFTKSTRDPLPSDPNDLWIWLWALNYKPQIFGHDNPVYTARRGALTVYFWQEPQLNNTSHAFVFDTSNPDSYIRIFSKNIPFEEFKKILGSATVK